MRHFKNILFYFIAVLIFNNCSIDYTPPEAEIIASCSDNIQNGDETGVDCGGNCANSCIDPSDLSGSLKGEINLDPSITYKLTNGLTIESGATLLIPAGTRIEATPNISYILIEEGADLVVNGTANNPVVITSPENAGAWGGIVITGNSVTSQGQNISKSLGGLNFTYGGNDLSENSGTLQYLILKNAGMLNNEAIPALSLYGVGSGTTIENIALINNGNGIAYIGGTVASANLYFKDNSLSSIIVDEGWRGSQVYSYISNEQPFSAIAMLMGPNEDPVFNKLTAYTNQNTTGFIFNDASGARITELSLNGHTPSFVLNGNVMASSVLIEDQIVDTEATYTTISKVNEQNFSWAIN